MGRKSDARQRLMDAAFNLICEHSYGAITIDAICLRAQVKKGSFYYFFSSKSDLAVAAIDDWWTARMPVMRQLFDVSVPPLERITGYLDFVGQLQLRAYETTHQMLGCPLHALGAEICTQDERIKNRVMEVIAVITAFFEEAIHDAQVLDLVIGNNAAQKARILISYYAGSLTEARIQNNPDAVRTLTADALSIIGARITAPPASFSREVLFPVNRLEPVAQLAPFS